MTFKELNLNPDLAKGIQEMGFEVCTPVQESTIQRVLNGKDVTVQSQTGTGKTAAFLISIFQLFLDSSAEKKKALIIAPTRELVVQIQEEGELIGKYLPFKIASIMGGTGYKKQEDELKAEPDIIVGTPGRLLDFMGSKKIKGDSFGFVVIDEADRLFDMGFFPDLKKILRQTPPREERTSMLFSATLSVKAQNLSWDYMNFPEEIRIESENLTVEGVNQELYHVASREKMGLLLGILKREAPPAAIVFCNTRYKVVEVALRLEKNGHKASYLIGDLPQRKRLSIINQLKAGELNILVATDVAARGLHVEELPLVINYDLPEDYENYVHRIGRTARAGKTGKAVSLACENFVYHLDAIEEYIDEKIPSFMVSEDLLAEDGSGYLDLGKAYRDAGLTRGREDSRSRSGSGAPRSSSRRDSGDKRERRAPSGRTDQRKPGDRSEKRREAPRYPAKTAAARKNRGDEQHRNDKPSAAPASGSPQCDKGRPLHSPERPVRHKAASGAGSPAAGKRPRRGDERPRRGDERPRRGDERPRRGDERPRRGDERRDFPAKGPSPKGPSAKESLDDRLEYYRKKYGEDFKPTPETLAREKGRKPAEKAKKDGGPNKKGEKGVVPKLKKLFRKGS